MKNRTGEIAGFSGLVFFVSFIIMLFAAWITHIVVAIKYITSGIEAVSYAVFLVAGAILPPVGVIHGIGIWFSIW